MGRIYAWHATRVRLRAGGKEEPIMAGGSKRGFASMDREKQRQIASKGGKAAHQKGTAHEFTPEEARRAGQKGGQAAQARNAQRQSAQEQPLTIADRGVGGNAEFEGRSPQ